ncbi:DNA and RNA helicase [Brevibacillus sp. 179-C9.3 HS]|uniref:DNA and RNA helicase n=1 Tax=unclassified Brevibacillus TaxID=2684853 RepID=UPI0039A10442
MFSHLYPNFHKGRILKREMLESLRDYPRHFVDLYFHDYTDGIISGMDVTIGEGHLTIGRGIVKHQGRIYLFEREERVPYEAAGRETVLKIRFHEETSLTDYYAYETSYVLDTEIESRGDERELGRFKLKEGARLRADYQHLSDMATEFNTWNIVHVEYSGQNEPTLAPYILQYFASEMLNTGTNHPYDLAFAMQGLNAERVERQLILHYIGNRLGTGYREYTNLQILKYLARILDDAKNGGRSSKPEWKTGGRQRVIVD